MPERDESQGEHRRGDRRQGDRRAIAQRIHKLNTVADDADQPKRVDYRGPRESFTVRTETEHVDVYARVAELFNISRNDLVARVMSHVLDLEWRTKVSDVPIALHRLPELVAAIQADMDVDELAELVEDIKREGVPPKKAA